MIGFLVSLIFGRLNCFVFVSSSCKYLPSYLFVIVIIFFVGTKVRPVEAQVINSINRLTSIDVVLPYQYDWQFERVIPLCIFHSTC